MFDSLYIGATGMRASQAQVDAIAQNVANLDTVGYRRNVVSFSEVSTAVTPTGTDSLDVVQAAVASRGAGALAAVGLSTDTGQLTQTNRSLDVAIDGAGFIEVTRPDGSPAYTRAGSLKLNADGMLSLADGTLLANKIELPPDAQNITIGEDGKVTATVTGQTQAVEFGRIDLVSFPNPSGLQGIGGSQFIATADSGSARAGSPNEDGRGAIKQGYVEGSNVQLTQEMVSMMVAQRSFEMNSRVVQAADQLMAMTNGLYKI
jgi:flagellar basal-body rod protein FlgG